VDVAAGVVTSATQRGGVLVLSTPTVLIVRTIFKKNSGFWSVAPMNSTTGVRRPT
jgi:hypothetical protein